MRSRLMCHGVLVSLLALVLVCNVAENAASSQADRRLHDNGTLAAVETREGEKRNDGVPVTFTLSAPGFVTLVIDDQAGARVRNVFMDQYFDAGTHTVFWDGYDEGIAVNREGMRYDVLHTLVTPGTYVARLLFHKGFELVYELSVQSPGNPPWHTSNDEGAWLADHGTPYGLVYVPRKSGAKIAVAANIAEAGHGGIWIDENGEKEKSFPARTGGFKMLSALAYDPEGDPRILFWAAHGARNKKTGEGEVYILGLDAQNAQRAKTVRSFSSAEFEASESVPVDGIAAYANTVVVSLTAADKLAIYTFGGKKLSLLDEHDIEAPRGVAFRDDGKALYVVAEGRLYGYDIDRNSGGLSGRRLVTGALEDPHRLRFLNGELYVSDWGSSHQVKVFSPSGSLKRVIGSPGGPQEGLYDETRMNRPLDFDVDARGKLWVAESAYMPKRFCRWDAQTGVLERCWYGPPKYGGGGTLDRDDPTRHYYTGKATGVIEFSLDWSAREGNTKPARILFNKEAFGERLPPEIEVTLPDRAVTYQGRRYLVTGQSGGPGGSQATDASVWLYENDRIRFVAWVRPVRGSKAVQVWSDLDKDGEVDDGEFTTWSGPAKLAFRGGLNVGDDLSIANVNGYLLPLSHVTEAGVPVYDVGAITRMRVPQELRRGHVVQNDAWFITTIGPMQGFDVKTTEPVWTYHQQHMRWSGDPYPLPRYTGQIIMNEHIINPLFEVPVGEAGTVFLQSGYFGNVWLFTADGYYVTELMGDKRTTPLWRHPRGEIQPGASIGFVSPDDEHFGPTASGTKDGPLYLVAGKEHTTILRVDGFEHVRRLEVGPVVVTASRLAGLPASYVVPRDNAPAEHAVVRTRTAPPVIDGDLSEWGDADFNVIEPAMGISAALAVSKDELYAAFRTNNATLLDNPGTDLPELFTAGGGLDVYLRTAVDAPRDKVLPGDLRVFVTRGGNNPSSGPVVAGLYEMRRSGAGGSSYTYASPICTVKLDRVLDVSSHVTLGQQGNTYELSIPLSVLGLSASVGEITLGDVGVVTGNGREALARLYWSNKADLLTSDICREAGYDPSNWGEWRFANQGG